MLWRPQNSQTFTDPTQFLQTFKALKSSSHFSQIWKTFKDRVNPVLQGNPYLKGERLVGVKLDEKNRTLVASRHSHTLVVQTTAVQAANQIAHALPLHADVRRQNVVSYLWVGKKKKGLYASPDMRSSPPQKKPIDTWRSLLWWDLQSVYINRCSNAWSHTVWARGGSFSLLPMQWVCGWGEGGTEGKGVFQQSSLQQGEEAREIVFIPQTSFRHLPPPPNSQIPKRERRYVG